MSLTLKTEYGRIVVAKLRQRLVTRTLFNENYRGQANAGAVMIPVTPEVSLFDYNKGAIASNTVDYVGNNYINCLVDKDKAKITYIDGYQASALPYNVIMDELEKTGYAIAKAEDDHAIATLKYAINGKDKGGSNAFGSTDPRYQKAGTVVSLGSDDIYEKLTGMYATMTTKGVPTDGRWLIANGTCLSLILSSNKAIRQSDLSQELVMAGAVAQIAGFNVFTTGNLTGNQTVGTGNDAADKAIYAIAGHAEFCTRVESFDYEPFVVDGNSDASVVGGSFIKSRIVFTHEVLNPEAFVLLCA